MAALCACEWRTIKHNTIYLTSVYTSIILFPVTMVMWGITVGYVYISMERSKDVGIMN